MSQTLGVTELNVRIKLGDTSAGAYAIRTERLRDIIRSVVRRWAMRLAVEDVWENAVFSFGAGDDQNSAGTNEFNRLLAIKNDTTGLLMKRVTAERMAQFYDGYTAASPPTGDPTHYTLTESNGATLMRVYPTPDEAVTFSALYSGIVPETLTDATSYDFSKHAMTGIETQSAAEAATIMKPADKDRLGITPEAIAMWRSLAAEVMSGEQVRLGRMTSASHIPAQVD